VTHTYCDFPCLYEINTLDGSSSLVVSLQASTFLNGLAFLNGVLYATGVFDGGFALNSIDLTTGATTLITDQAVGWTNLAANGDTGLLYVVDGSVLKAVDPVSGTTTTVGPAGGNVASTFDVITNTLYSMSHTRLSATDVSTGVTSTIVVGAYGGIAGLAFEAGVLYHTRSRTLYTLDVVTGAETIIGDMEFGVDGLTSDGT